MKADRLLVTVQRVPIITELGALKDTWIRSSNRSWNGGSDDEGRVIGHFGGNNAEMFLSFDVSSIDGVEITSATLRLAFFSSSAEGNTHWAYKILAAYNGWVEDELTYEIWKTGSAWARAGLSLTGTISISNTVVTGTNTLFTTELRVGDYIYLDAAPGTIWLVTVITSDTELNISTLASGSGAASRVGGLFSQDDFVTSSPAGGSGVVPALGGLSATEFDITAIVQDAIDNSINVNMVVLGSSPEIGTVRYDSKEAISPNDWPKLTVES